MYLLNPRNLLWIILWYFICFSSNSFAQENSDNIVSEIYKAFDENYGLDPYLYKGAKYYKPHYYKFGHPFWKSEEFNSGSVVLINKVLNNLLLKYDVYLDNVLLKYTDQLGAATEIILNKDEVLRFTIDENKFIRIKSSNVNRSFAQIIFESKRLNLLYIYSKTYGFSSSSNKKEFGYSKLRTRKFIEIDGEVFNIESNKKLVRALPKDIQDDVSQFIKAEKVKMKTSTKEELILLFKYINTKLS